MGLFKVVFYTKGSFVKDEGLKYERGVFTLYVGKILIYGHTLKHVT